MPRLSRNKLRSGLAAAALVGAIAAGAAGMISHAVWASDPVIAPREFADRYGVEWYDPFVSLAVAAERSSTLSIGFSVLVLPYRPALPTARALATLLLQLPAPIPKLPQAAAFLPRPFAVPSMPRCRWSPTLRWPGALRSFSCVMNGDLMSACCNPEDYC